MLSRILLNILLWIPFLLVSSLLVIPCSLFFLFRLFITVILRRVFRKNLVGPIANQDYGFSNDDFWNGPRSGIAFAHILEAPLHVDLVQKRLSEAILTNDKILPGTATTYQRLTSISPRIWLGFAFWKKVKEFDITKHIRVYEQLQVDEGIVNVDGVLAEWLQSPFERDQPLWNVLLIPDFVDKMGGRKSLFGFRIHHVIGDGYSMLEFLQKIFDEDSAHEIETSSKRKPKLRMSLAKKFEMCFWMPITIGKHFSDFLYHSDYFSTTKTNGNISLTRITLKLADLKTLRRKLGENTQVQLSFVTVILFVLGGALRKLLLANSGIKELAEVEVGTLKNVNIAIGLPRSTPHPMGTFCNHWAHGVYEIPIRNQSRLKRLNEMMRGFTNLKNSEAFEMNGHFTNLYSILPRYIYWPLLWNLKSTTIGMANLPGPTKPVKILGKIVREKYALLGLQLKNASFTLACFSYNNEVTLTLVSNQEVFDDNLGKQLLGKYFKEEVKELLLNGIEEETLV